VREVPRTQQVRIVAVEAPADGVRGLRLASVSGAPLAPWQPGCHIDVFLPSGQQRQYSLCSDPLDLSTYRLATRRIADGGGGSVEVHDLELGSELTISEPRNAFPFVRSSSYVFVVGGIGITPILPMIQQANRWGSSWTLLYTGRSRASLPFIDDLIELAAAGEGELHVLADDELGAPTPEQLRTLALSSRPDGRMYCCGPAGMSDGLRRLAAESGGVPFHFERFSPPPVTGGAPFELEFARSGTVVTVGAEQTALVAARRINPATAYSCQQGFCGTCKVRVLSGDVDHRDQHLSPAERQEAMMLCVSRGRGKVVVEL